jgi:NADPH:quinone reductase-like Zn-dependent oxidoreductase/SAM-dependent methyltransferase
MMAVALSEAEVLPYLQSSNPPFVSNGIAVGCVNSPKSVTLSGERNAMVALHQHFQEKGIFARILRVPVAYHSAQMKTISSAYESAISEIDDEIGHLHTGNMVMISSVLAAKVNPEELRTSKYWVSNLVSPVFFSAALTCILRETKEEHTTHTFLEMGPHSTLQGPIGEIIRDATPAAETAYCSMLLRNQPGIHTVQRAMGELYSLGHRLDLSEINRTNFVDRIRMPPTMDLPRYPFDESKRYWHESRLSKSFRFRRWAPHDLLGVPVADWNDLEPRWRNVIRIEKLPFIEDHKINNIIVYPAAAMIAAVLEGVQRLVEDCDISGYEIEDAHFIKALVFSQVSSEVEIELRLRQIVAKDKAARSCPLYEFRLYSYYDEEWIHHCEGRVRIESKSDHQDSFDTHHPRDHVLRQITADFNRTTGGENHTLGNFDLYEHLFPAFGYNYGPAFQGLTRIHCGNQGEASASICPLEKEAKKRTQIRQSHIVHPATMDAALQLALVAASKGGNDDIPTIVPKRIQRLWISSDGLDTPEDGELRLHAVSSMRSRRKMEATLSVFCPKTEKLLMHVYSFEGTSISSIATNANVTDQLIQRPCYRLDWKPDIGLMTHRQMLDYCWHNIKPKVPEEKLIELERTGTALLFRSLLQVRKDLAQSSAMPHKPHLRRYLQWKDNQADAFLSGRYPEVQARYDELDRSAEALRIARECAQRDQIWGFYLGVADNLLGLVTGQLDILQLLFGDNAATGFYTEMNEYSRCGEALARYIELLAHKTPGMRILEVGAGTGSTTRVVLRGLHTGASDGKNGSIIRFSRYDFTDISPSLVSKAQEEFGSEYRNMHFAPLDIQISPDVQDFQLRSYDLVVAGSSLHATADLSETLRNVRALLKPDGKLILHENVKPKSLRMGFAFGLLPGWWLGIEDFRQESPCLSNDQWADILHRNGFSGIEVELRDFEAEECHETSVLVAGVAQGPQNYRWLNRITDWPLILADLYDPVEAALAESVRIALQEKLGLGSILGSLEQTAAAAMTGIRCILLNYNRTPALLMRSEESFSAVRSLVKKSSDILWVTEARNLDPHHGLMHGLTRTVRRETLDIRFATLAVDSVDTGACHNVDMIVDVFGQMLSAQETGFYEPEYLGINGVPHISRLLEQPIISPKINRKTRKNTLQTRRFGGDTPLKLDTRTGLGLSSLQFVEDTDADLQMDPNEIEIQVRAIGCNFMDVLSTFGLLHEDFIGLEVSGIVRRTGTSVSELKPGDRAVAFSLNAYQNFVRTKECLAVAIPETLSFVESASIPINYSTAYRALVEIARLKKGESVLIHSAAGGTGQAALQLALHIGASVFATVGSKEKKQFLISHYNLDPARIMSSRDTRFRDSIYGLTHGAGVDVVLNSLSGELLDASWECIAPYGRFIEIGKTDIRERSSLNMGRFSANTLFASVDLAAMIRDCPEMAGRLLKDAFSWIIDNKTMLYDISTYGVDRLESGFRHLSSGLSHGKIVIEIESDALVQVCLRTNYVWQVLTWLQAVMEPRPRLLFCETATYVIAGGFGGLGRSIARWMTTRGARNLLLLSRSTVKEAQAESFMLEMESRCVRIEAARCDISSREQLQDILDSTDLPPIRGCIQASMVLKVCGPSYSVPENNADRK